MIFNSLEFYLFFPFVFFVYWVVFFRSLMLQNLFIVLCSYFFYAWWSWKFLGLLLLVTILDFFYGFFVASKNRRKAKLFLWLSLINNLGILCIFKYFNFFSEQLGIAFRGVGFNINPLVLDIAIPVGISFYTFHGISYVIDIYSGKQKPIHSFIDYSFFVSFFPLLVAGPIERATHLLPQIQKKREFNYAQSVEGGRLILWGLFKKIVIADSLAPFVNLVFDNSAEINSVFLILGAIAFSFQIYGDFSGYSDIAIGTAKLLGIELLSNFKFPYFSRDIAEFWRRWHISLTSWFRDYVYIPMGGSQRGLKKTITNTLIVFLISGFWHGASWNFIVWGVLHAFAFMPLLISKRNRKNVDNVVAFDRRLPSFKDLFHMMLTFCFVTFAWIFFRSDSFKGAILFVKRIFTNWFVNQHDGFLYSNSGKVLMLIFFFIIIEWYIRLNDRVIKVVNNIYVRRIIYSTAILVVVLLTFMQKGKSFIYFQF